MIVVDASVLTDALVEDGSVGRAARTALESDLHWAAPALLPFEVVAAIRGKLLGRKISAERAAEAVGVLGELAIDLVDPNRLVARIWQLRGNVSAYDAAYIAVAELLQAPLVMGDLKLSRAIGPRCEIRLPGDWAREV